jgi:hypothetical protein
MEIRQFDKMAISDQSAYVGLLVSGAEWVLKDEGRADLAAQVDHFFTTTLPGDAQTIGSVEFEVNPMPSRTIRKSNRPRASDRTMVDAVQPQRLPVSETDRRRHY